MTHTAYTKRYLVLLVALLMLVSIINVADKELLAPVADAVRADLGMNDTQLGAVRSAVFLTALLGQLFWGPLSDRWVRKYIIVIGTVLWSAVTWVTAFVGSFMGLLTARAGMSFAEGCFNPSAYALITDSVPKRHHGLVLGLLSLTYPVGTASALVVASLVGTHRWRQPFLGFGVIGVLLGILVLWLVREPRRGATEEAVEAAEGVYTGKFSLKEFRQVLMTTPSLLLIFALDTCQASVNWSFAFWAPSYLTRYGIAPDSETAALALLPAILGFVLGAVLGGWLIDRLRPRTERAAAWVALTAMSGGLLAALFVFNLFELASLMLAAFFLGVVAYMVMPAVNILMFSVVPPETKATTISVSNVILNLVIAGLTFLIGVVSDAAELRLAFGGAVTVMFALGIVVCLALLRTIRGDMSRQRALVAARVTG
ncbi:MAG: MFS transporter [Chloroflexi bacterium]|nr:MFS transporter [Chloroflexota bacterium]